MGNKPVLVLGGGITGLSAALELVENGEKVVILEKERKPGGMARTINESGYYMDFAPHAYHSTDPEFLEKIFSLVGEELEERRKDVRINFRGKYFLYPLKAWDLVLNMNPLLTLSAVTDFMFASHRSKSQIEKSSEDWLINRFGRTLYEIFFGPYSAKVWGVPLSCLSPEFAEHRIPYPNLWNIIKNILIRKKENENSHPYAPLVRKLFYPRKGAGCLPEKIQERILEKGGEIFLGCEVKNIDVLGNRVVKVKGEINGKEVIFTPEIVLSTIPLPEIPKMLSPSPERNIVDLFKKLRFRDLVILSLVVKGRPILSAQSIYYTNKLFNRISEIPLYGGVEMVPSGYSLITLEITCAQGDYIWDMEDNLLMEEVIPYLEEEDIFRKEEIVFYKKMKLKNAYPVYLRGYEEIINHILSYLGNIENLYLCGRQGFFKYIDMDLCWKSGRELVLNILKGESRIPLKELPYQERLFF